MKGRLTVVRATDGQHVVTDLQRAVKLEELQAAVGGYIELVPYFTKFNGAPCSTFCDEEGKLKSKPFNIAATQLWGANSRVKMAGDILVGDVVIVTGDDEFLSTL